MPKEKNTATLTPDEEKELRDAATRKRAMQLALDTIEKQFGKGSIRRMGDQPLQGIEAISTRCIGIDNITGVGGIPRSRITEIYGPECVADTTFIQYTVWNGERRINSKGGSIARLYERFHGLAPRGDGRGKNHNRMLWDARFTTVSMNEMGRIVSNEILNVVSSGIKQCFEVKTEKGCTTVVTGEHQFFIGDRYVELNNLNVGDTVFIHNGTPFRADTVPVRIDRPEVYVKAHSVAPIKRVGQYVYYRLKKARAVIEAEMNSMSLGQYITRLNSGNIQGLLALPRDIHAHHEDENPFNDDRDNLLAVCASEHGRIHATERHNNLRFTRVEDRITSIVSVGLRETFDLIMKSPYNNYVADNFIVHNSSGKTSLALHLIAEAQSRGLIAALVDAEHALSESWAETIGVNISDLYISQPQYGEQALDITEALVRSGAAGLIVVDSVAALVPRAELEGEMGDQLPGLQARMMGQAMRKLTAVTARSNTALVFINQIRDTIPMHGQMYGPKQVTTGGRALKFYSSLRLEIKRIASIKRGEEVIGNLTKVKAVKNKMARPFLECEIDLIYGQGISSVNSIIDTAVEWKILTKDGKSYSYAGEKLAIGRDAVADKLKEDEPLQLKIKAEILEAMAICQAEKSAQKSNQVQ